MPRIDPLEPPVEATDRLEEEYRRKGYRRIAGIDEAGRGPWAGPVVAAACLFHDADAIPKVEDSKRLSPRQRKLLYEQLTCTDALSYGIGVVGEALIDQINIFQATLRAMEAAIAHLPKPPDFLLVDGTHLPCRGLIPGCAVVRGDQSCRLIAAASILAKEYRDRWMEECHQRYPEYGFDQHKGYGTPQHRLALLRHGPSPLHRRTFAPVREALRVLGL